MNPASRRQVDGQFKELLEYLKAARGIDFTGYKPTTLMRRVGKRMDEVQVDTYSQYRDYLEVHPEEYEKLFDTILINVTEFFRDTQPWDYLAKEIIPQIISNQPEQPIRIWSAGCASGQETYSLAMIFTKALGLKGFLDRVKIFATDIDESALSQARSAMFTEREVDRVPEDLRKKYFRRVGDHMAFDSTLRRAIIFGRHDLIQDAPISHLDLLVCRNTLMYLNAETQSRVLSRLHFALKDSGFMFLGKAEMLLTHTDLFKAVELKHRIFAKVPVLGIGDQLAPFSPMKSSSNKETPADITSLHQYALEENQVAQMIVDHTGILVSANGRARDWLGILPGDLGKPLRDLEVSYRPVDLRTPIDQVYSAENVIVIADVPQPLADGRNRYLDISLSPLRTPHGEIKGIVITAIDSSRTAELAADLRRSTQDLETAYEELQSANEELETSNEELQSTVEELETTNEELQSSNEELETMNEELRSTNEELQSLNLQVQDVNEQVEELNVFLSGVLSSIGSAVIVLDRNFNVREWNVAAQELWGVGREEAKKQSLLKLELGLPVDKLLGPIRRCLKERSQQQLTVTATNRRGKSFECRVVITPLVTSDPKAVGVILLAEELKAFEHVK